MKKPKWKPIVVPVIIPSKNALKAIQFAAKQLGMPDLALVLLYGAVRTSETISSLIEIKKLTASYARRKK